MEEKNTATDSCMACACPCDQHTEHTHPLPGEKKGDEESGKNRVCSTCGAPQSKDTAACDCNK